MQSCTYSWKLNEMAGYPPDQEIDLYEELHSESELMIEPVDKEVPFGHVGAAGWRHLLLSEIRVSSKCCGLPISHHSFVLRILALFGNWHFNVPPSMKPQLYMQVLPP